MPLSDATYRKVNRAVVIQGYLDGCAAGSWVIDGNTSRETIKHIWKGLDDGDPETLDALPSAPSGEWADDPNIEQVVSDIADDHIGDTALTDDEVDSLVPDYMDAYSSGVVDEVEWTAGTYLGVLNSDAYPRADAARRKQMAEEHADTYCGTV